MESGVEREVAVSGAGFLFPPGGLMVWMFIVLELVTFGAGLGAFSFQMAGAPEMLAESQDLLNVPLATINTLVLLTSGWLAALGVVAQRQARYRAASGWILGAALLGTVFCVLKGFEYRDKLESGHGMDFNTFFSFYWALTGFHLLHVAAGILILLYFAFRVRGGRPFADPDMSLETAVAFWHLCDLIWVLVFPVIYLIRI